MATGPGKYDDACTVARESTAAEAVLLVVIDGSKGSGFSVQATDPKLVATIPTMLRRLATEIEIASKS